MTHVQGGGCAPVDAVHYPADDNGVSYFPASTRSFKALADLYNRTRIDYIVPMPMNARRLEEYVALYDVCLEGSLIAIDPTGDEAGIAMLGLRGDRAWVTRLGVVPDKRRFHIGRGLTRRLLDCGRALGGVRAQLEVIEGNEPAYRLFESLGFAPVRDLLVIRRSPGPLPARESGAHVHLLDDAAIDRCLESRTDRPTWIEEHASLRRAGGELHGWQVSAEGRSGWIVVRTVARTLAGFTTHPITHAVFESPDPALTRSLLHVVHDCFPDSDTEIENLPANHPHWDAFSALGYVVAFRRIEMLMRV